MRVWLPLGAAAAIVIAGFAELVFDIRMPHSGLAAAGALAAVISFPTGEPDPPKKLAGMYGLFVVNPHGDSEQLFPFSIVPGDAGLSTLRPNLAQLRDRFEAGFPASAKAYDAGPSENSCASRPAAELGPGWLTALLRVRGQTNCVVRWDGALPGARPGVMLVSVTLADADPWMRPFARRICRTLTETALSSLRDVVKPGYAACVLVDRPGRIRPGDAQDTYKTVVYEVRDGTLARMD
jgi:hypothetical protein